MRILLGLALSAAVAFGQTNAIQICDQQATRHCMTIKAPATLPANVTCTTGALNLGDCANGNVGDGTWGGGNGGVFGGASASLSANNTWTGVNTFTTTATGVIINNNSSGETLTLTNAGAGGSIKADSSILLNFGKAGETELRDTLWIPNDDIVQLGNSSHRFAGLFLGTVGLNLSITGSTQCLQADTAGLVSGTGLGCGQELLTSNNTFTGTNTFTNQVRVTTTSLSNPGLYITNPSGTTTGNAFEIRDSAGAPVFKVVGASNSTFANAVFTWDVVPLGTTETKSFGNTLSHWKDIWTKDLNVYGSATVFSGGSLGPSGTGIIQATSMMAGSNTVLIGGSSTTSDHILIENGLNAVFFEANGSDTDVSLLVTSKGAGHIDLNGSSFSDTGHLTLIDGCTGCNTFPITDSTILLYSSGDSAKQMQFDLTNVGHSQTMILKIPAYGNTTTLRTLTLAALEPSQTFAGQNTFSAVQTFNDDILIGNGKTIHPSTGYSGNLGVAGHEFGQAFLMQVTIGDSASSSGIFIKPALDGYADIGDSSHRFDEAHVIDYYGTGGHFADVYTSNSLQLNGASVQYTGTMQYASGTSLTVDSGAVFNLNGTADFHSGSVSYYLSGATLSMVSGSTMTINSGTTVTVSGSTPLSTTITIRNSAGSGTCTVTFTLGYATATTC